MPHGCPTPRSRMVGVKMQIMKVGSAKRGGRSSEMLGQSSKIQAPKPTEIPSSKNQTSSDAICVYRTHGELRNPVSLFTCDSAQISVRQASVDLQLVAKAPQRYAQLIADIGRGRGFGWRRGSLVVWRTKAGASSRSPYASRIRGRRVFAERSRSVGPYDGNAQQMTGRNFMLFPLFPIMKTRRRRNGKGACQRERGEAYFAGLYLSDCEP